MEKTGDLSDDGFSRVVEPLMSRNGRETTTIGFASSSVVISLLGNSCYLFVLTDFLSLNVSGHCLYNLLNI